MAFWWRRRRKPWFGRWRYRRNKYKGRRRRQRRRYPRRRRRTTRRHRKRRTKVRRKKKAIVVRQWQPESVVKCKIKGTSSLVLGAEGKQFVCYTTDRSAWTPPKAPSGGGFGCELITLQYLYEEYRFRNNIWTKSNILKDLCRYLGGRITCYRHPNIDFVVQYTNQPPFDLNKYSYLLCHPHIMLQAKHKRVVLSTKTKPTGSTKVKIKFKPTKQMLSQWFFQEEAARHGLVQLQAAACSFNFPKLGCCNTNQLITLYFLNPQFWTHSNWGQAMSDNNPYTPYLTYPTTGLTFHYPSGSTTAQITIAKSSLTYLQSIHRDTGFFQPKVLLASKVTYNTQDYGHLPCGVARYNINLDNGKGNKVWWKSILVDNYTAPRDQDLIFEGVPLWLALFGWSSYINQTKKDPTYLNSYMLIVQSPAIHTIGTTSTAGYYPLIDSSFQKGNMPYGEYLDQNSKKYWYPTYQKQKETINAIVKTGPLIPKLENDRESTWELLYSYCFYFKWGGPQLTDQQAHDPSAKETFNASNQLQALQISNPEKQKFETIFHNWDYRRGEIKKTAFKRMLENLSVDTSFQPDADFQETPQKRIRLEPLLQNPEEEVQKIKGSLLSLYEESTFQEEEKIPFINILKQQHEKQQQLKHNLLILIQEMKHKQKLLQLRTGLLH
nr:MAG: ORF1 [Torque teno midi virus]